MKKIFSILRGKPKGHPSSVPRGRDRQLWFTNDFFKFLLGFSLLILVSFGILAFFGSTSDSQSTASDVLPGCDTTEDGTSPATAHC